MVSMKQPLARLATQVTGKRQGSKGFSLAELMVVITILGVLSALAIDSGIKEWRREKVNKVAIELSGWLENARRAALKGQSCTVSINTGTLAENGTLATATCMTRWPLQIALQDANSSFSITASSTSLTFTPRGTVHPGNSDLNIRIALNPDQNISRCVAVQGLLGEIAIGKGSASSCVTQQKF